MQDSRVLVCFTASYPYGRRETYFENELKYLSKNFSSVLVIPTYNPYDNGEIRKVPHNVAIGDVILPQGKKRVILGIRYFKLIFPLIAEFFSRGVFLKKEKLKNWINDYLSYCIGIRYFKQSQFDPKNVVLYSYWAGKNFFIDKELDRYRKIVRMHGGDFYEERSSGYLPLRQKIYSSVDLLLPISNHIRNTLMTKYKINERKIFLSYLGVENNSISCSVNLTKDVLKVVSCSNVYPLKRVYLIFELLQYLRVTVEWTHIGEGESFDELEQLVKQNRNEHLSIRLMGFLNQEEIKHLYQTEFFDFFINTSADEGLPVSIMEAFSFGIPAIATNVGGTSEIVNDRNGIIIDKLFDLEKLAKQIGDVYLNNGFLQKRKLAFETWNASFNAENNYVILSNLIKDISK